MVTGDRNSVLLQPLIGRTCCKYNRYCLAETIPLFGDASEPFRSELRKKLTYLAQKEVFIGTSSWKYEGWIDQVYSRDRYLSRGRFSKRIFEQQCLTEYAETFPTICGDFAFYQFPAAAFWKRLFHSSPHQLQFSFKVPEEITTPRFPKHPRYGVRAGRRNANFLDVAVIEGAFLKRLEPYTAQVSLLIFEFGAACGELFTVSEFTAQLSDFLHRLPPTFRYAVEVRNPEFLADAAYLEMLRARRVAHVFNAWTQMPSLREQANAAGAFTADFIVVRALLRQGRNYEDAVRMFSPYSELKDRDPDTRRAIQDIIVRCVRRGEPAFIYVNNRLEGNAPVTIHEILTDIDL